MDENHLSSVQLNTSKADVYVKLSILDHDEEMLSAVGKGHVVLPSFLFLKDITAGSSAAEEQDKRPSSRSCKSSFL